MSQLKFAKGTKAKYKAALSDGTNKVNAYTIFFATDTKEIILNSEAFGVSADVASALESKISSVTFTTPNKIEFFTVGGGATAVTTIELPNVTTSANGLMSKEDKGILDVLNGAVGTEGSVKYQVKVVQDEVDALEVAVDENKVVNADSDASLVIVPGSTAEGATSNTTIKVNVKSGDNALKLSNDGLYVDQSALTSYEGKEAISIADKEGATGVKEVSLTIKSGDKILKQTTSGLESALSINYDSNSKKVQLLGLNSDVISEFDASAFVKDGMLSNAELVVNPEGQAAGTYLKLTFNTDAGVADPILVNVTSLIDVYTAGNGISISGKEVSVKIDSTSEGFLEVGTAGVKLSGVQDAIDEAAADAKTEVVEKTEGHVTVAIEAQSDGHDKVTIAENDIASAALLGTTSDTSTSNTAFGKIAAEVARASAQENTIEAAIGLSEAGAHVASGGTYTNLATTIAGEIAALDTQLKTVSDQLEWVELN